MTFSINQLILQCKQKSLNEMTNAPVRPWFIESSIAKIFGSYPNLDNHSIENHSSDLSGDSAF